MKGSTLLSDVDWLDPRPEHRVTKLAPRRGLENRRLVVFDNGKMSPPYGWAPLLAPIVSTLEPMGSVTVEREDLLSMPAADMGERVAEWRRRRVDGVVFGLCDAGVLQPTIVLAAKAEAAGIPTAVLCTEQVLDVAAVASYFVGEGIPLIGLSVGRLDPPSAMIEHGEKAAREAKELLCTQPESLQRRARDLFPFVGGLARPADGSRNFSETVVHEHLSDGLPVVRPAPELVDALIGYSGRKAGDVVIPEMSPSGAALTVRDAAICSVMAGCTPERFPLVLAALSAMASPDYQLRLSSIATHPGGNLLLFSGPAATAVGLTSGRGCLGGGNVANLSIGRAVSLCIINVGRAIPGLSTLSQLGSPAQLSYCCADLPDGALPPLNRELARADESVVLALKCEGPHTVLDHLSVTPEGLLMSIADVAATIGGNNAYIPRDLVVFLNPEHAELLVRAGWNRARAQEFLWKGARNPRTKLSGRGAMREWPASWADWEEIPVVPGPDRIWIVVAGAPGPHSAVAIPWLGSACWRTIDASVPTQEVK